MGWALPENPNPPDTVCIMARVPNDPAYIDAFWGAILDLGAGFKWADDSAHTAILASRRMRQMYYEMVENNCIPAPNIINAPCSSCCEGCMAVRWNGCTLEEYDCSTQSWIPVPSINQPCVPNTAPGSGQTPPGPGVCQKYGLQFDANALTVLPFLVNTGDTIQVLSLTGAGTDGTVNWSCPDGSFFIAGACVGGGGPIVGDPLVGANHMSVVVKVGSTYYPLVSGTLTLPSGIVNQQIYIGVNDSSLSDDRGTYGIDFQYCNNQTPPVGGWCQSLDLTISPQGIVSYAQNDGCPAPVNVANWQSGVGWVVPAYVISCSPSFTQFQATIALDLGLSTTVTSVEIKGNYSAGATGSRGLSVGLNTTPPWSSSVLTPVSQTGYPAGAFDFVSAAISQVCRYVQIDVSDTTHGTPAGTAGYTITRLILKGTGANPFASSNC